VKASCTSMRCAGPDVRVCAAQLSWIIVFNALHTA